jgi:hypothetical protein
MKSHALLFIEREGSRWLTVVHRGESIRVKRVCTIEDYCAKDETHTLYRTRDGRYFLKKERWISDGRNCDGVPLTKITSVSFGPLSGREAMAWFIKDRLDDASQFQRLFLSAINA